MDTNNPIIGTTVPVLRTESDNEKTKQITVTGWTMGITAIMAGLVLLEQPGWPVAFAVSMITAIIATLFSVILKRD